MLTLLLALAEPAAAGAAPGPIEGLKDTFVHFGVEPKFLVMQIVSFLILFGILYKFGIKPTIATPAVIRAMSFLFCASGRYRSNKVKSDDSSSPGIGGEIDEPDLSLCLSSSIVVLVTMSIPGSDADSEVLQQG